MIRLNQIKAKLYSSQVTENQNSDSQQTEGP